MTLAPEPVEILEARRDTEPPSSAGRLILVEGASDRIALETLARRRGLDRPAVVVLGGAHAVGNLARRAPGGVERCRSPRRRGAPACYGSPIGLTAGIRRPSTR